MARYETGRRILTSDEIDLEELLDYGEDLTEQFNADADRMFQAMLGQQVDTRTFRNRVGDIEWRQSGEVEKPRTGRLDSESMAFTIEEYDAALGWTRNFVEDNPASILMNDMEKLMEGADDLMFEKTFEVMDNGIADGQELEWTKPPEPGAYEFDRDHNHVFPETNALFDDEDEHTPRQHISKAAVELAHHNYNANLAFVSPDFAYDMVYSDSDALNYQIREARELLTTPIEDIEANANGVRVVQTAELSGNDFYVFDTSLQPLYYNWVRPIEITQEDGVPVADPSELIGAYGSARFGIQMVNPWAGVKVTADAVEL